MRILLDMQGAQCQSRHRGIGRYTLDISRAFAPMAAARHDIRFAFNAQLDEATDAVIAALQPCASSCRRLLIPALGDVAAQRADNAARRDVSERLMRHGLAQAGADIVWFSSMIEGYVDDALIPASGTPGTRTAATLYDLIPLHDPDAYLGHPRVKAWYEAKLKALSQCDLLLSISEWVRQDALARLGLDPSRIVTIGGGVDSRFRPPTDPRMARQRVDEALGTNLPYVLYNGGFDPRKNVARLVEAFGALPPDVREHHRLVIVGRASTEQMTALKTAMRTANLPPASVLFPGYVPDDVLVDLYASCALFVFPSTLEGFGLPPLEAMSCGAPVISSHAASLPEVIGHADAMFDPLRVDAIAKAMAEVLQQPARTRSLRQHALLQASRFTWEAVASRALAALESLAARPAAAGATVVRKVAMPSLLCVSVESAPEWLDEMRQHHALSVVSLNEASAGSAVFSAQLDAAGRILYVASIETAWCAAALMSRWPGALLLVPAAATPPQPPSIAQRYAIGGYAACADENSASLDTMGNGCIGILLAAGVAVPPSLAPHGIPTASLGARPVDTLATQLETWFAASAIGIEDRLLAELAPAAARLDDDALAQVGNAIVALRPAPATRQWLVDVTQIAQRDIGTGIQRMVRSILFQWLRNPPTGVRIEPIAFIDGHFRYARRYALRLLGLDEDALADDFVQAASNDVYIGLDWSAEAMASTEPLLRRWHRCGTEMHFVVNDLLPVTMPDAFHPFARNLFEDWLRCASSLADGLHCISAATAGELSHWLDDNAVPYQFGQRPAVDHFLLGAEVAVNDAPRPLPTPLAEAAAQRPTLLMVGTLEPRKGHVQALDAIEHLWTNGHELNFVIVGRVGWMVEALVRRLEKHDETGRRLFWFQDADDAQLEAVYRVSSALLAPSFGEGYGLPLVEAAHRQLPVLARDLPVFREIMGEYASYFRADDAAQLAKALSAWLHAPPPPKPHATWPTWAQSAAALASTIQRMGKGLDTIQTIV